MNYYSIWVSKISVYYIYVQLISSNPWKALDHHITVFCSHTPYYRVTQN